ncbi:unnamed protein product [Ranitomeya imitator]|uniref:RIOX1/NO66-like C-terminal winged helix domain-containing protein n=1 Tax=Ranitomeya imitator TaxID=111125 RepID=A0ABN9LRJ1_9NEOB|nr:unnamed protein product [Ranitomeya imitator]
MQVWEGKFFRLRYHTYRRVSHLAAVAYTHSPVSPNERLGEKDFTVNESDFYKHSDTKYVYLLMGEKRTEKDHSVYGAPARWENGDVTGGIIQLEKDTQIRFLRRGIVRLCSEGEVCLLYYSTENSRVYHQAAPKSMEVDAEHMDAIEYLIHRYPQYATVESLPCEDLDDKLAVANMLFEKGLLTTKERLTPLSRTVETE